MYILSYLIACKTDLKTSSNPYLILEALMNKLCKLDEMEDIAKIIEKLNYGSITQTQPISNISSAQSQPVQSKDSTKESAVKIPDAISKRKLL
jgi:DNA polymerase-3 subunit gamma/tau